MEPGAETGSQLTTRARLSTDAAAPSESEPLIHRADVVPPASVLEVTAIGGGPDHRVRWRVTDEDGGSGFKHVTLYVAKDGGDFEIWQRQLAEPSGETVHFGQQGHTYEFLAMASDAAGNREQPPLGRYAPDDGSRVSFGTLPGGAEAQTPQPGQPPQPSTEPSTNALFLQAERGVPSAVSLNHPADFDVVLEPLTAEAFATGFTSSGGSIGPLAIAQTPGDEVLISGGRSRNEIYRLPKAGGEVGPAWAVVDHPVFNLTFGPDGRLWATTGGGPLLELDPDTGDPLAEYGDGITLGLAVDERSGALVVGSRYGVERFNPGTGKFTRLSRDRDLRVGSLAYDSEGALWGVRWPQRDRVVRFNPRGRAETMLSFQTPIDSIAFGPSGTPLEGLLFVSHHGDSPANARASAVSPEPGRGLTMVDVATLRQIAIARGGSRGDVVTTTSDGSVLVSQSGQVDLLRPVVAAEVVATNPAPGAIAALPLDRITVTFSEAMDDGPPDQTGSVRHTGNYALRTANGESVTVREVHYDPASRTAFLAVGPLSVGPHTLLVSDRIESRGGFPMSSAYQADFKAVAELSELVDIQVSGSRSHRANQTVTYEVTVRNIAERDLRLPAFLTLEAGLGTNGRPNEAALKGDGRWMLSLDAEVAGGVTLPAGEATTARTVQLQAPGDDKADFHSGVLASAAANQRPVFQSEPVPQVDADDIYRYDAEAVDPDGSAVAYWLGHGPPGLTVDQASGEVVWGTTTAVAAENDVLLYALDASGGWTPHRWTIVVDGGNRAPAWTDVPADATMSENQVLRFTVAAADPDDDPLVLWADRLPPHAHFDGSSGTLVWRPRANAAGTYRDITLFASDGVNTIRHSFDLRVADANRPPAIDAVRDVTLREGDRWTITLPASDPDGDRLRFTSEALPSGARLDPGSGTLHWSVRFDQAGTWEVPVAVTDGTLTSETTLQVNVLPANVPPKFPPMQGWSIDEGQVLSIRLAASDPDLPDYQPPTRLPDGTLDPPVASSPIRYSAEQLPDGATFDAATATLTWTPGFDDAGDHAVTLIATDDGGGVGEPLSTRVTVPIRVREINRRPQIPPMDGGERPPRPSRHRSRSCHRSGR